MNDITECMLCFRDAAVHTWNCYIRIFADSASLDTQLSRDRIEFELLRVMVLRPYKIDLDPDNNRIKDISEINISVKDGLHEIPAYLGKVNDDGNVYWSECILYNSNGFPELSFQEFFDWDSYGHVSMNIVRAVSSDGSFYLIEDRFCAFNYRN